MTAEKKNSVGVGGKPVAVTTTTEGVV